ncbi:threonine synthase [Acinetobacter qingfengensis]|uniref:Threonine synthase n=1 Tax=Acinetobacter qingfengensis TaxID=1262585 RepID=A0A1E7RCV5_9GAMM|nr:threonine synthase [Acinetobacter qingfengensis]KAA8732041.1 threonine synthase [Acinetobacter qingfengensis]OEY97123.1 threonine synthase [Acinetobacter qingfengensis]
MSNANRYTGLVDRYRDRLPVTATTRAISLGEGNTPLIKLENIPRIIGKDVEIYVKYEGLNPTGSFKDRGMTMAVTKAVEEGSQAIICASTGNTSAAAAAYAARAGIKAFVLIPEGKIAMGKMAQAMMYGAITMQIRGNFDDGMRLVKEVADQAPVTIVNSINPYRLQGQKTAAFEIVEALGQAPDYHALPVGNAGNITAHWMGYSEQAVDPALYASNRAVYQPETHSFSGEAAIAKRPTMLGYQAAGAAPFLRGAPVDHPETVATAIRIGNPQSWNHAHAVMKESGGWFDELQDQEILEAQRLLTMYEGVFVEPASAASVGGVIRDVKNGKIPEGSVIVCTVTGNGLKDPDTAIKQCSDAVMLTIDATMNDVKCSILSNMEK